MTNHRTLFYACVWVCTAVAGFVALVAAGEGSLSKGSADISLGGRLSREKAAEILSESWLERQAELLAERDAEVEARVVRAAGREMTFAETKFGERPAGGRSLWISLHGGGGAPAQVNDQQWRNQGRLYKLEEGYYVAPRAPTDAWNMWHEDHMDALIDRLIENYVVARGVDPNRVYLLGYSAGGDGVYQLAPRMADRFAAAAMMAGHPNNGSPLGLRNLPFAILVGGRDAAYDRNRIAGEWAAKLGELARADASSSAKDDESSNPGVNRDGIAMTTTASVNTGVGARGDANAGGYRSFVRIFPDKAHWMDREDAVALPWMASMVRDPWPRRVVWEQGNRIGRRFYWLALPSNEPAKPGAIVRAEVGGQKITLTTRDYSCVVVRLSDKLVDLDQPLTIVANGNVVFAGRVERSVAALKVSLQERADPASAASVLFEVKF